MRKGLLGDLSTLVKAAKSLQETLQSDDAQIPIYEHLDELVLKSFKLVTRAIRFLDIWAADTVSPSFELGDTNGHRPLTPPSDSADHAVQQPEPSRTGVDNLSANDFQVPVTQGPLFMHDDLDTATTQPPRNLNRLSFAFSLPSETDSLPSPLQPSQSQSLAKRISVTHRLSYTKKSPGARRGNLASERINTAQDVFVGFIASFIGLHMQSRSSEELAHITQQSVVACRQLLAVVEEVWERDSRRSQQLQETRDTMYARLTELVQATKDMFSGVDGDEEEVVRPGSEMQLVDAATSCVRSAGECVAKARFVIERIGDFELETTGLGLPDSIFDHVSCTDREEGHRPRSTTQPEPALETNKPLPAPPSEERQMQPPLNISESKPLPDVPQSLPLDYNRTSLQPTQYATTTENSTATPSRSSRLSLPVLAQLPVPDLAPLTAPESLESPVSICQKRISKAIRNDSVNGLTTDTSSTFHPSTPGDCGSVASEASTRATTPDHFLSQKHSSQTLVSSFGSSSELRSLTSEDIAAGEEHLLETTYVHELIHNKEGQISGGSLPALVEQLTTHDSTPDAVFVTTFYLTFRLFATPMELAQCLIDRFDYIGDSQSVGVPVRLRVYNVFKGWLESHWSSESDSCALGIILTFATGKLRASLPPAGKRLAELTAKVTEIRAGAIVPRLVSAIGKTSVSNTVFTPADSNVPTPIVSRSQLNALRASKEGRAQCSILDFDPLELARQITIIESRLFCSIQSEELLALEWTKKSDCKAFNVKAMITLSTDLANLVADTILHLEDPKKRAVMIKQWIKVAAKCLELNNYDSLMAIICSLNSSMVMRLKRTWELVPAKHKTRLEELKTITDVGRNYAVLRQRLHNHVAPCIPFVGIYLTDLTFIDAGNCTTRQLRGEPGCESLSVINFDKHMKTAKIVGQLQSFQVPYRLVAVPEMQDWMETQIQRVRQSEANVQSYYRRSLVLEPRDPRPSMRHSPSVDNSAQSIFSTETRTHSKENLFEFLNFNFTTSNLKSS